MFYRSPCSRSSTCRAFWYSPRPSAGASLRSRSGDMSCVCGRSPPGITGTSLIGRSRQAVSSSSSWRGSEPHRCKMARSGGRVGIGATTSIPMRRSTRTLPCSAASGIRTSVGLSTETMALPISPMFGTSCVIRSSCSSTNTSGFPSRSTSVAALPSRDGQASFGDSQSVPCCFITVRCSSIRSVTSGGLAATKRAINRGTIPGSRSSRSARDGTITTTTT